MIDEKSCIRQAINGDSSAFAHLVEQYQTQIYRLCLRMTNHPEDAADLTQETFLKAWRALAQFRFDSSFSTWLYRLATNTCIDFLRQVRRRPTASLVTQDSEGEEQTLELPDNAPGTEAQVLARMEREQLHDALCLLPEEQRTLLVLRAVNGLSYAEIAALSRVPEGTVKSRLARAREALRKKLLQSGNYLITTTSNKTEGGEA